MKIFALAVVALVAALSVTHTHAAPTVDQLQGTKSEMRDAIASANKGVYVNLAGVSVGKPDADTCKLYGSDMRQALVAVMGVSRGTYASVTLSTRRGCL